MPIQPLTRYCAALLLLLTTGLLQAEDGRMEPLSPLAESFMNGQRGKVEDLAQRHLGRSFSGVLKTDLELLQEILNRKLVDRKDTAMLQAMGVVLGDLLAKQEGLRWVVWTDRYGESKALSIPGKYDVVFPVTSISRRYEVGAKVDVERVYSLLEDSAAHIRKKIYIR